MTAAAKDIVPLGVPLSQAGQAVDGQAYMVGGRKMRFSASAGGMVPFSGSTAPSLPGLAAQGSGQGQSGGPPPVQGARQARDGNWYVPNPSSPGKFLMVSR